MELIYFLESLFGQIIFSIGNYEFNGCRPIAFMDLPWKNEKEMYEYRIKLEKENTQESYQKYVNCDEQFYCHKIHRTFSRSFLCAIASGILFILAVFLFAIKIETIYFLAFGSSVIMMIISYYLKIRADKFHAELCMCLSIYNLFETWPPKEKE